MKLKKFAESIIFQCLEDLWDAGHAMNSVEFFSSEEFQVVASMASMDADDRVQLLKMVNQIIKGNKHLLKPKRAGRARTFSSSPACPPHSIGAR